MYKIKIQKICKHMSINEYTEENEEMVKSKIKVIEFGIIIFPFC